MFLKQLKLSGFKSFVEPTIIPLAKSLIGVVGPNGCGKSNLIDAVRWVMGESSAKSLRGESMTDVIFNGSSTRKPLGQASVELLFDNSMGRLVGQYAAYQEIAVKRIVSRDGDSSYFLNGTRCRRRDITDLFLGTGAGTRGYAIIGQGTISRLIEARPDELRVYLEEAAGVSKYKERRKETCQRIAHTRDNLVRVADICVELDKQLERLQTQAQGAKQYQALKKEEQHHKAVILILKQRACLQEMAQCAEHKTNFLQTAEQHQSFAAKAWQDSITLKEQWHQKNEAYQKDQALFYEQKTELARLEETLKQQKRDETRLLGESEQLKTEHAEISSALQQCHQQLLDCDHAKAPLLKAREDHNLTLAQCVQDKTQLDTKLDAAMAAYLASEKQVNFANHERQKYALEIKYQQSRTQDLQIQLERLELEYTERQETPIERAFEVHENTLLQLTHDVLTIESQIEQGLWQKNNLRNQVHEAQNHAQSQQAEIRKISTQIATLQATIDTVLGKQEIQNATDGFSMCQARRFIEQLRVEELWQPALEMVLGESIRGFVVDDLSRVLSCMPQLSQDDVLFASVSPRHSARVKPFPRLIDKITGDLPCLPVNLNHIYVADDLNQALTMQGSLDVHESILTPDGYWLSAHWVVANNFKKTQKKVNILAKQAQLTVLLTMHDAAVNALENTQAEHNALQQALYEQEAKHDELQKDKALQRHALHEQTTMLAQKKDKAQQHALRMQQIEAMREELLENLEVVTAKTQELIFKSHEAEQQFVTQQTHVAELEADLNALKTAGSQANQALDAAKQQIQTNQLALQKLELSHEQYKLDIERHAHRIEMLLGRLRTIQNTLEACAKEGIPTQNILNEKMDLIVVLDAQLHEQQAYLHNCNQQIELSIKRHQDEEKRAKSAFEKQQKATIEEQVLEDRMRHFSDALQEIHTDIIAVLKDQTFDFSLTHYLGQQQLTLEKIELLGAVNLTAIEEYERESARKQQLDAQYQDLQDALSLLESAMHKIDHETQQRFSATYDAVNSQFKLLFPKLFGGGRAELSLTCDNLLEAGILVTAQPPGKRNASIHLLSGGEKAMTAVALVFAIFQLNPSPFCMLDEVDAPLDDVNIGRFCELVKDMSAVVQFLFITHNKVTMMLAEQLIGVTTREAGVSRIVTVDVEEAVELCHSENIV